MSGQEAYGRAVLKISGEAIGDTNGEPISTKRIGYIAAELKKQLKQKALILPPVAGLRRAGFLAELGLKRIKAGDYDNATTLQPLYFRGPSITKPKHR